MTWGGKTPNLLGAPQVFNILLQIKCSLHYEYCWCIVVVQIRDILLQKQERSIKNLIASSCNFFSDVLCDIIFVADFPLWYSFVSNAMITTSRIKAPYNINSPYVHESHEKNTSFRETEWDVATSWQLRGLCGCYVVCVAVTGSTSSSFSRKSACRALTGQIYARCDRAWHKTLKP